MSYDINSVVLVGRLVRDPEMKTINNDKTICQFSIASGDGKEKDGQDKTNFVDVTAWDKTAQFVGTYIKKGSQVAIKGKLKQDRWQDKQTGANRSKISINATDVQSVGGKSQNDSQPLDGNAIFGNFPTGNHQEPTDGVPF